MSKCAGKEIRCPVCGAVAEKIYWKRIGLAILGCDKCIAEVSAEDALHID